MPTIPPVLSGHVPSSYPGPHAVGYFVLSSLPAFPYVLPIPRFGPKDTSGVYTTTKKPSATSSDIGGQAKKHGDNDDNRKNTQDGQRCGKGKPVLGIREIKYAVFYPCSPSTQSQSWLPSLLSASRQANSASWLPRPFHETLQGYQRFLNDHPATKIAYPIMRLLGGRLKMHVYPLARPSLGSTTMSNHMSKKSQMNSTADSIPEDAKPGLRGSTSNPGSSSGSDSVPLPSSAGDPACSNPQSSTRTTHVSGDDDDDIDGVNIRGHARNPLVIFSHGLAGNLNAYSHFCASLASNGYVVLAISHQDGSGPVVFVPEGEGEGEMSGSGSAAESVRRASSSSSLTSSSSFEVIQPEGNEKGVGTNQRERGEGAGAIKKPEEMLDSFMPIGTRQNGEESQKHASELEGQESQKRDQQEVEQSVEDVEILSPRRRRGLGSQETQEKIKIAYVKSDELDWTPDSDPSSTHLRSLQIQIRLSEIYETYYSFCDLLEQPASVSDSKFNKVQIRPEEGLDPINEASSLIRDLKEITDPSSIVLTGHSFGGGSLLHVLRSPAPKGFDNSASRSKLPVSGAIALDPWIEPLPDAVPPKMGDEPTEERGVPLLIINSEGFTLWRDHFQKVLKIAQKAKGNLVSVIGCDHQSFSDFPALVSPSQGMMLFRTIERMAHDFLTGHFRENRDIVGKTPDHGKFETVPAVKENEKRKMKGEFAEVVVHELARE